MVPLALAASCFSISPNDRSALPDVEHVAFPRNMHSFIRKLPLKGRLFTAIHFNPEESLAFARHPGGLTPTLIISG
jgi:hypothetical protein